ncbi:MAG: hypothetical protein ACXWZ2_04715 [Mycobacterium sp.]
MLIGSVAAVGIAVGSPAVAGAEAVWDIGAYDSCVAKIPTVPQGPDAYERDDFKCCTESGGVYDHGNKKCVSPPAESQSGRTPLPRGVPTHILTPEPLPTNGPVIAPAPGGVA